MNSLRLTVIIFISIIVRTAMAKRATRNAKDVAISLNEPQKFGPITKEQASRRKRSLYSDFEFDLTQEERAEFVLQHNGYRTTVNPTGADVQRVVWDTALEIQAQIWASYCTYEHGGHNAIGDFSSVGQNLWAKVGFNVNNKPAPELATSAWWNEESDYDYDSNTCSGYGCGHYTQMAWDWTVAIGCGRNYCPDDLYVEDSSVLVPNTRWIIVCHYGPGGNRADARPYTEGESCSACLDGYSGGCTENLCLEDVMCLGATCENGGVLNTTTCLCDNCNEGSVGAFCQGLPDPDYVAEVAEYNGYGMHNGVGCMPDYVTWFDGEETCDDDEDGGDNGDGGDGGDNGDGGDGDDNGDGGDGGDNGDGDGTTEISPSSLLLVALLALIGSVL